MLVQLIMSGHHSPDQAWLGVGRVTEDSTSPETSSKQEGGRGRTGKDSNNKDFTLPLSIQISSSTALILGEENAKVTRGQRLPHFAKEKPAALAKRDVHMHMLPQCLHIIHAPTQLEPQEHRHPQPPQARDTGEVHRSQSLCLSQGNSTGPGAHMSALQSPLTPPGGTAGGQCRGAPGGQPQLCHLGRDPAGDSKRAHMEHLWPPPSSKSNAEKDAEAQQDLRLLTACGTTGDSPTSTRPSISANPGTGSRCCRQWLSAHSYPTWNDSLCPEPLGACPWTEDSAGSSEHICSKRTEGTLGPPHPGFWARWAQPLLSNFCYSKLSAVHQLPQGAKTLHTRVSSYPGHPGAGYNLSSVTSEEG